MLAKSSVDAALRKQAWFLGDRQMEKCPLLTSGGYKFVLTSQAWRRALPQFFVLPEGVGFDMV